MNFEKTIDDLKININDELKKIYNSGPSTIKEPIYHILKGGKRIRPILCLLTSLSCGGKINDALETAVAIELLHNFTLIHDDIMDNDDLRHGNITIHKKWNDSIAILSGDAMLAIALIKLNNLEKKQIEVIKKFNKGLIEVCEGQALDLDFQNIDNISEKEYLEMIDKKTAYMIGLSSELGAILANANNSIQDKLRTYGLLIGRAFQIQDDLLEITSDKEKMGKTLKSDFLLNKKTYLNVKAHIINSDEINKYISIASKDFDKGFSLYKAFLKKNKIISDTESTINNILVEADSILKDLDINTDYLYKYTQLILNRKC
jgi:geranylgeranyl pyrophosphate synthase